MVLCIQQHIFENGSQATGACAFLASLLGHRPLSAVSQHQLCSRQLQVARHTSLTAVMTTTERQLSYASIPQLSLLRPLKQAAESIHFPSQLTVVRCASAFGVGSVPQIIPCALKQSNVRQVTHTPIVSTCPLEERAWSEADLGVEWHFVVSMMMRSLAQRLQAHKVSSPCRRRK